MTRRVEVSSRVVVEGPVTGLRYVWGGPGTLTVNVYRGEEEVDAFVMEAIRIEIPGFEERVSIRESCAGGIHSDPEGAGTCEYCGEETAGARIEVAARGLYASDREEEGGPPWEELDEETRADYRDWARVNADG